MKLLLAGYLTAVIVCFQGIYAQYHYNYLRRYGRYPFESNPEGSFLRPVANEQGIRPSGLQQNARKVLLEIFYATDCPDSMRFITRQLMPVYKDMEDIIDLRLVPYGKTTKTYDTQSGKHEFSCQHGPAECYGNAIQACAISFYPNVKEHLDFISCMEAYPRPSQSGQKCARRLSLDWTKIDKCASGDEGNRLVHVMGEITENLNPRLYFIPWVVVNKVHTTENQRLALRDLTKVVCNAYKGSHPKCSSNY